MSFEGEIGEIDLIQRLVELGGESFTGAIRFESDGIIKIVYFKTGDVLSASTNDRTDAIDEILARAGKVTREHVKQALAKRKESETLGDALLGLGFITRKELTWARRVQVIGILRSIIGWKTGSYTIVADYLPKREEGTLFPLSQIIVELVVTDTDRSKSEQAMESGNAVFGKAPNFDDGFRRLGLNDDAEQIVAQIDGSASAAEVASRSGKDVFNVYKLIEALRLLRLVTRVDKPPAEHEVYAPSPETEQWGIENPDFTLDDVAPTVPGVAAQWTAPADAGTMQHPTTATAKLPAWIPEEPAAAPKPATHSVWDEPDGDDAFAATAVMPAAASAEPQWGFDEAQIEAARRAAVPVHGDSGVPTSSADGPVVKPAKPRSRLGFLLTILAVLIIAGAAYPAWLWWQSRSAPEPGVVVRRTPPKLKRPAITLSDPSTSTSSTGTASPPPGTMATASAPASAFTTTTPVTTSAATTTRPKPPAAVPLTTKPPVTASIAPPVIRTTTHAPAVTPPAPLPVAPRLERTSAGAAISNTPQTTPTGSDLARAKYDGMARDFASQKDGSYTLQFELVCETASVTKAISAGGGKVWFVPTSYRGRPCYRVFWGRFETSAEASAASKQFPAALGATAVVVKIPRG
jgi:septal ring-binding cell division protein DamX